MSSICELAALREWLSRPESYPHRPEKIETVETHISLVFLADEYVYKLKKPVRFDFLDFSSLALREQACRDEVRLNRRLAPETYLDVVAVYRRADGGFCFEPTGEPVEWLVRMRRLPTELTLDRLFQRGAITPRMIDDLAERLATFYAEQPPEAISAEVYRARYRGHIQGNRRELLQTPELNGELVRRVHSAQLEFLLLRPELFSARVRAGRIVEGHGDLRPEHICLTNPPVIFDCIEFNREYRQVDIADELSFLAVECEYLGLPWIGERLLRRYRERTDDAPPAALSAFYRSYRACVRAKVAALRGRQLEGAERSAEFARATRYLRLADREVSPGRKARLLLIGGHSGTGKSTLARAWAEVSGAEWLRTDTLRTELFPGPGTGRDGVNEGVYSRVQRRKVYETLLTRAGRLLKQGVSVVADGTFSEPDLIQAARHVAETSDADFLAVRCECPFEIARARIARRRERGGDPSQATEAVLQDQWRHASAYQDSEGIFTLDTRPSMDALVQTLVQQLTRDGIPSNFRNADARAIPCGGH